MRHQASGRYKPSMICGLLITVFLCLCAVGQSTAQTPRAAGEISFARQVTINGRPVGAGGTVFSHSQIKTANRGGATLNLGKVGRMELGADTDYLLAFSAAQLAGELKSGQLMISLAAGIGLELATPKGTVFTDGGKAAVLTVEMNGDTARVAALMGEARIVAGGRAERVTAGNELTLGAKTQGTGVWQHKPLLIAGAAAGAGGAVIAARSAQAAVPAAVQAQSKAVSLSSLLNAGVNYSLSQLLRSPNDRDPDKFFTSTISCRDHENVFCTRRSNSRP